MNKTNLFQFTEADNKAPYWTWKQHSYGLFLQCPLTHIAATTKKCTYSW